MRGDLFLFKVHVLEGANKSKRGPFLGKGKRPVACITSKAGGPSWGVRAPSDQMAQSGCTRS